MLRNFSLASRCQGRLERPRSGSQERHRRERLRRPVRNRILAVPDRREPLCCRQGHRPARQRGHAVTPRGGLTMPHDLPNEIPIQPVERPVICPPYSAPTHHWLYDTKTGLARKEPDRRPASYWYRTKKTGSAQASLFAEEERDDLPLVNLLREDVKRWREADYRGASNVTRELCAIGRAKTAPGACSSAGARPSRPSSTWRKCASPAAPVASRSGRSCWMKIWPACFAASVPEPISAWSRTPNFSPP